MEINVKATVESISTSLKTKVSGIINNELEVLKKEPWLNTDEIEYLETTQTNFHDGKYSLLMRKTVLDASVSVVINNTCYVLPTLLSAGISLLNGEDIASASVKAGVVGSVSMTLAQIPVSLYLIMATGKPKNIQELAVDTLISIPVAIPVPVPLYATTMSIFTSLALQNPEFGNLIKLEMKRAKYAIQKNTLVTGVGKFLDQYFHKENDYNLE